MLYQRQAADPNDAEVIKRMSHLLDYVFCGLLDGLACIIVDALEANNVHLPFLMLTCRVLLGLQSTSSEKDAEFEPRSAPAFTWY